MNKINFWCSLYKRVIMSLRVNPPTPLSPTVGWCAKPFLSTGTFRSWWARSHFMFYIENCIEVGGYSKSPYFTVLLHSNFRLTSITPN
jgi:hypothetical protein